MRKKKYYNVLSAVMLSASLLFSSIFVGNVKAEERNTGAVVEKNELSGDVIKIGNAEDFEALVKKSTVEAATMGKTYVLTQDISLEGVDFKPISIFAGELDGQGHSITGFSVESNSDMTGFIRSVGKTGYIHDLHVSGNVAPNGVMKEIGGVSGRNYGVLENVSFSGYVLGAECVGGITGRNMEGGEIISCNNDAIVLGTRRTGGIAGFNEGTVRSSRNSGRINAESTTAWETDDDRKDERGSFGSEDMEELDETNEDLAKLNPDTIDIKDDDIKEKLTDKQKINYTGGIAGASAGVIENCTNEGTVGYKHTGYKTGGIVGYERGILTECRNTGVVYGRKDVGGIAGQFEPFVLNSYSTDSFSEAGDQLDDLVDMTDKLHNTVGSEDDRAQQNIDAIRNTADDLRQTVSNYKTYYQCKNDSVEREIRSQVDGIRGTVDEIDPDVYSGDTKKALKALKDSLGDLQKLLDSAEEAAGSGIAVDMTNYMDKLIRVLAPVNDSLADLSGQAAEGVDDLEELEDQLNDIRDKSGSLDDYLRGCIDDYKSDIRKTDDDITGKTDSLAGEMDILSEGLKDSDEKVRNQLNTITGQMQTINSTLDDGFDEVQQELDRIQHTETIEEAFDDVSDDPDMTPAKGAIISSVNTGKIDADFNVGGIVGIMDYDRDIQSDFEVVSEGQISLNYKRTRKATILDCTNRADVTARNDYAGGIVGRAEMGAVLSGNNFGRVEAKDGDYAGGVAGKSAHVIRDSYSMSEVSGNSNVGGIAGYGSTLTGSACLSNVGGTKEHIGAVLGEADPDGLVKDNIFVQNGTGAVDGYTVETQTRPVNYGELMGITGLPTEFRQMQVNFDDNGTIIKSVRVKYGGSVRYEEYPPLPKRTDGRVGYWENLDLSNVRQNTTIHAVYVDYITTIATPEETPKLLVSGNFYDNSTVTLMETQVKAEQVQGYHVVGAYRYEIQAMYGKLDENYVLRFLVSDHGNDITAASVNNGEMTIIPSERDGNYLVFSMTGDGEFVILKKNSRIRLFITVVLILMILCGSFIFIKKRLKKRK